MRGRGAGGAGGGWVGCSQCPDRSQPRKVRVPRRAEMGQRPRCGPGRAEGPPLPSLRRPRHRWGIREDHFESCKQCRKSASVKRCRKSVASALSTARPEALVDLLVRLSDSDHSLSTVAAATAVTATTVTRPPGARPGPSPLLHLSSPASRNAGDRGGLTPRPSPSRPRRACESTHPRRPGPLLAMG